MPYAAVEFEYSNEIEIVNQNWIILLENDQYVTLFPPKSKYRVALHSNNINENWKTYKIVVLKQNIENYKHAVEERNYREKGDTDTNDEIKNLIMLKRKHPVWESQSGQSLNLNVNEDFVTPGSEPPLKIMRVVELNEFDVNTETILGEESTSGTDNERTYVSIYTLRNKNTVLKQ